MGELYVVAPPDGHVDMTASRLRQAGDRPFGSDLPAQVELVDGRLRLSVNVFLVIDHGEHILIDTGAANAWEHGNRRWDRSLTRSTKWTPRSSTHR